MFKELLKYIPVEKIFTSHRTVQQESIHFQLMYNLDLYERINWENIMVLYFDLLNKHTSKIMQCIL